MSKHDRAIEFERYVASLYRALGYVVEHDVKLNGQQCDLVCCRRIDGFGDLKLIIECKFKSYGSVSNQEVQDFKSTVQANLGSNAINAAVMMTNVEYSRDAKDVARPFPYLTLKTIRALETELLDDNALLARSVTEYQDSEIFRQFVTLNGTGAFPKDGERHAIENLDRAAFDWASNAEGGLLLILADFGGGKSTLLRRLNYRLACAALERVGQRKPLYVELKYFRRHNTVEDLVFAALPSTAARTLTPSRFLQVLSSGGFVVLLDGFDEIGTNTTARERASILLGFRELIKGDSPVIITSRPTYFSSVQEINSLADTMNSFRTATLRALFGRERLPGVNVHQLAGEFGGTAYPLLAKENFGSVTIEPFNAEQIETYLANNRDALEKVTKLSPIEVVEKLRQIYDLEDLMKRPILLSLLVQTILEGAIDIDSDRVISGASELYEIYTGASFARDFDKGETRRFLTAEQRRFFCQCLSIWMLENNALAIAPAEVAELIQAKITRLPNLAAEDEFERIVTDLRVCSFLKFSEADGNLRFTHKSFMEFFVAQRIYSARQLSAERLWRFVLPKEVIYFLGAYCIANRSFFEMLRSGNLLDRLQAGDEKLGSDLSKVKRNLAAALISGSQATDNIDISDLDLFDVAFSKCKCDKLDIRGSNLRNVAAKELQWREALFDGVDLLDCSFTDCRFESIRIRGSVISTKFCEAEIEQLKLEGHTDSLEFDSCSVAIVSGKFNGNISFTGGRIGTAVITTESGQQNRLTLNRAQIQKLKYSDGNAGMNEDVIELFPRFLVMNGTIVERLEILGVRLDGNQVSELLRDGTFNRAEGLIIIDGELPSIMLEPETERERQARKERREPPPYKSQHLYRNNLLMISGRHLPGTANGRLSIPIKGLPGDYLTRMQDVFAIEE